MRAHKKICCGLAIKLENHLLNHNVFKCNTLLVSAEKMNYDKFHKFYQCTSGISSTHFYNSAKNCRIYINYPQKNVMLACAKLYSFSRALE